MAAKRLLTVSFLLAAALSQGISAAGTLVASHPEVPSSDRSTAPSSLGPFPGLSGVASTAVTVAGVIADVWAVGGDSIEHWDGKAWHRKRVDGYLTGITATSPIDAWAVGYTQGNGVIERPLVLHWDGRTWSRQKAPTRTT